MFQATVNPLGRNVTQVRIAGILGHTTPRVDNQAAHNAARDSLQSTPPLFATDRLTIL